MPRPYWESPAPQSVKNAKIIKLTDLYESQISKHMFKCLNLNSNVFPKHSDIHYTQ